MLREVNLDPILGCSLKKVVNIVVARRRCLCRSGWQEGTDFEEHLFQACWGDGDQHAGRAIAFVLERVQRTDGDIGKLAGGGDDSLSVDGEGDFPFEDEEGFFFATMDVRGRPTSWWYNGVDHGVMALRVASICQNAVDVTDDSDGLGMRGSAKSGCHGGILEEKQREELDYGIRRCGSAERLS